jgi:hypothetical protein
LSSNPSTGKKKKNPKGFTIYGGRGEWRRGEKLHLVSVHTFFFMILVPHLLKQVYNTMPSYLLS